VVRSRATANFSSDAALRTTPYFTHDNPHFCINDATNLPNALPPASHQFWLHASSGLYTSQMHKDLTLPTLCPSLRSALIESGGLTAFPKFLNFLVRYVLVESE
jgi:hypothetical protein